MVRALEPRATYLAARAAGAFALDEAEAVSLHCLQASVDLKSACRKRSVLVDVRQMHGQLTLAERYAYREFVAVEVVRLTARGGPEMRLAYGGHPPLIDPNRFGMMVARNRGALLLATEDLKEALRRLSARPAPAQT